MIQLKKPDVSGIILYYIGTRTTQYYTYIVLVPHAPIYKRCTRRAGTIQSLQSANSLGITATDNNNNNNILLCITV